MNTSLSGESFVRVDLAPELIQRVETNQEALVCLSGMAYLSVAMLQADQLPNFKRSLSMNLADFMDTARKLAETDFRDPAELCRARETSDLWSEVGWDTWQDLGVIIWNRLHTKVNIRKASGGPDWFRLDIGPFGKTQWP